MDEIHNLHWYGKYSLHDITNMTYRERVALGERVAASIKAENEAYDKALKGK